MRENELAGRLYSPAVRICVIIVNGTLDQRRRIISGSVYAAALISGIGKYFAVFDCGVTEKARPPPLDAVL